MTSTRSALRDLTANLDAPGRPGVTPDSWRRSVRQQLAGVRDLLLSESAQHEDTWLAARGETMLRQRNALLARFSILDARVLEAEDVMLVCAELKRLLADVAHHVQRVNDLAYDEVEQELGGSD